MGQPFGDPLLVATVARMVIAPPFGQIGLGNIGVLVIVAVLVILAVPEPLGSLVAGAAQMQRHRERHSFADFLSPLSIAS